MSYFFKMLCIAGTVSALGTGLQAQDVIERQNIERTRRDGKEVIIRKKTDTDVKVTIEIKGEDIKVNGKPLSEFDDKNFEVELDNIRPRITARSAAPARSPFRSSLNFQSPVTVMGYGTNSNKAMLGVATEKVDDGAKVLSVTKGSAAEKAGIKSGDIITKIDDAAIANPEELVKALGKYKPEDKVAVVVKRDKKEQKYSAVLAKPATTSVYSETFDFNYNDNNNGLKGFSAPNYNLMLTNGTPRLGIKAQDTDDGKGVKVLGVDKNSAAEKSGLKEGDLITEFDGKAVNETTELMEAARTAKDKNNMKLKLLRDGKLQDVDLKIPKKLKTANL